MSNQFRKDFISYLTGVAAGFGATIIYFGEPLGFACIFISILIYAFNVIEE